MNVRTRVGIDLVDIRRITETVEQFGERFLRRVFTEHEIAYATASPDMKMQRLATRFAAKEAAVKALGLASRGVGWRQIEVRSMPSGECELVLHGDAADGVCDTSVSLSHEGDYATAVVMTQTMRGVK